MSLMLRTIYCAMARALTLYYRSLRTVPTLLRRDNISGRPYMGVMTYTALAFPALKYLGSYHRYYALKTLKPIEWCINEGNTPFWLLLKLDVYFHKLGSCYTYIVRFTY